MTTIPKRKPKTPLERTIDRMIDKAVEIDSCCHHTEYWIDNEIAPDVVAEVMTSLRLNRQAMKDTAFDLGLDVVQIEDIVHRFLEQAL